MFEQEAVYRFNIFLLYSWVFDDESVDIILVNASSANENKSTNCMPSSNIISLTFLDIGCLLYFVHSFTTIFHLGIIILHYKTSQKIFF